MTTDIENGDFRHWRVALALARELATAHHVRYRVYTWHRSNGTRIWRLEPITKEAR